MKADARLVGLSDLGPLPCGYSRQCCTEHKPRQSIATFSNLVKIRKLRLTTCIWDI